MYGLFENNSDGPVMVDRCSARFYTGDGILIATNHSLIGGNIVLQPGERVVGQNILLGAIDPGIVATVGKIVFGLQAQPANDVRKQEYVLHIHNFYDRSILFSEDANSELVLSSTLTHLSSDVLEEMAFQLLFYREDELIAWSGASGSSPFGPGIDYGLALRVYTVDDSITIEDLEQATVVYVGDGYFSDERS